MYNLSTEILEDQTDFSYKNNDKFSPLDHSSSPLIDSELREYKTKIFLLKKVIASSTTSLERIYSRSNSCEYMYYANIPNKVYQLDHFNLNMHGENIFYLETYKKKIYTSVYIVYWIEQLFESYEFEKVNTILKEINMNYLDEWSIVALLRSTLFAKDNLPAWGKFLEDSKNHLISKNKNNIDEILLGLDR